MTTCSFIYGPGDLPIEHINDTTGTVTYLHHDQAGSTRLITGSTGTVTGKCSYGPYGTQTREGTDTTPGSSTCVRESTTRNPESSSRSIRWRRSLACQRLRQRQPVQPL